MFRLRSLPPVRGHTIFQARFPMLERSDCEAIVQAWLCWVRADARAKQGMFENGLISWVCSMATGVWLDRKPGQIAPLFVHFRPKIQIGSCVSEDCVRVSVNTE